MFIYRFDFRAQLPEYKRLMLPLAGTGVLPPDFDHQLPSPVAHGGTQAAHADRDRRSRHAPAFQGCACYRRDLARRAGWFQYSSRHVIIAATMSAPAPDGSARNGVLRIAPLPVVLLIRVERPGRNVVESHRLAPRRTGFGYARVPRRPAVGLNRVPQNLARARRARPFAASRRGEALVYHPLRCLGSFRFGSSRSMHRRARC